MNSLSVPRLSLVLVAGLFVLASCGSSDESDAALAPPDAPDTPAEETTSVTITEATSTAPDTRTEQEIAVDKLDLMMIQLGLDQLEELESATSCVMDRLESEGVEFTGEGTADLIALSECNDTIISAWLPSTNSALADDMWACTVESIGEWIGDLSIADAEAFFAAASPPEEFIEQTADSCNATTEEIAAAF